LEIPEAEVFGFLGPNGSGYPNGLKGEEIPLSARIFAVVDEWDALTSDRPYRRAWKRKTTRQILDKVGGKEKT